MLKSTAFAVKQFSKRFLQLNDITKYRILNCILTTRLWDPDKIGSFYFMNDFSNTRQESKTPKYQQVVHFIEDQVRQGKLRKGNAVSSINRLSDDLLLSRDTVLRAYEILRKKGVIISVRGKGYFINRTDIHVPYKILLLFNKISNYKKQVYNSFVETMGDKAVIDLKIHHFNSSLLEGFINNHLPEYDYFVIMPHFYEFPEEARRIIKLIPLQKLVILDKDVDYLQGKYAAVFQDFRRDIQEALESGMQQLKKFNKIILVQPQIIPYPPEIAKGVLQFCRHEKFEYAIVHEITAATKLIKSQAYIVIEDTDLVNLIKNCHSKGLKIGKDIGIISCNETPLKEILLDGITVITTDHAKMGETAATLILENRKEKIRNPFRMILRNSL